MITEMAELRQVKMKLARVLDDIQQEIYKSGAEMVAHNIKDLEHNIMTGLVHLEKTINLFEAERFAKQERMK